MSSVVHPSPVYTDTGYRDLTSGDGAAEQRRHHMDMQLTLSILAFALSIVFAIVGPA